MKFYLNICSVTMKYHQHILQYIKQPVFPDQEILALTLTTHIPFQRKMFQKNFS